MQSLKYRPPWMRNKAATVFTALKTVGDENDDGVEKRNSPTLATPATPNDRSQGTPDDGFEVSKHEKRKQQRQNNSQTLQDAYSTMSGPGKLREAWGPQRQAKQEARKTIDDHQAKSIRKGTEQLHQAARASAKQSNQGSLAKIGNAIGVKRGAKGGVKFEKEYRTKTVKHGVSFKEQQPGWFGWCKDIYLCASTTRSSLARQIAWDRHPNVVNQVAMYSYGDTGLAEVPENERDEYLNVIPGDIKEDDYIPQNPNKPNLKIIVKYGKRDQSRQTMVVRVTKISTRNVDCDELEKIRELDPESTKILIAEVLRAMGGKPMAE